MKHVVTGGCGFIGSHLVDYLIGLGYEVVVLDNLSSSEGRPINPEATLVKGSVTDLELVTSATEGADCVFHTAAWARVPRSVEDPVGTHEVNVNGTLNVLQAARENGRRQGRVLFVFECLWRPGHPLYMREDMVPYPIVALRAPEVNWRAVRQHVCAAIRDAGGVAAVLQRLWSGAGGRG